MEPAKARREAAILFVAACVLGVVFGGVGDRLWNQHLSGELIAVITRARPTNDQLITNFCQMVKLSAQQRKQLADIMDDTEAKWRALYAPLDAQREAIRQQGRTRVRAIFKPEQIPKFESVYEARR